MCRWPTSCPPWARQFTISLSPFAAIPSRSAISAATRNIRPTSASCSSRRSAAVGMSWSGTTSTCTYASYGLEWANVSNTPFRLFKSFVHEGGIAMPFIARWAGVIAADTTSAQVGHVIDLLPTFLAAAGAPARPLEGRDLFHGGADERGGRGRRSCGRWRRRRRSGPR